MFDFDSECINWEEMVRRVCLTLEEEGIAINHQLNIHTRGILAAAIVKTVKQQVQEAEKELEREEESWIR